MGELNKKIDFIGIWSRKFINTTHYVNGIYIFQVIYINRDKFSKRFHGGHKYVFILFNSINKNVLNIKKDINGE